MDSSLPTLPTHTLLTVLCLKLPKSIPHSDSSRYVLNNIIKKISTLINLVRSWTLMNILAVRSIVPKRHQEALKLPKISMCAPSQDVARFLATKLAWSTTCGSILERGRLSANIVIKGLQLKETSPITSTAISTSRGLAVITAGLGSIETSSWPNTTRSATVPGQLGPTSRDSKLRKRLKNE